MLALIRGVKVSDPDDYVVDPMTWDHRTCTKEKYFGLQVTYAMYTNKTLNVALTPPTTGSSCVLDDCDNSDHNENTACNASQGIRAHCDAKLSYDPYRLPCHWLALNSTALAHVMAEQPVVIAVTVEGVTAYRSFAPLHKCHTPLDSGDNTLLVVMIIVMVLLLALCCFAISRTVMKRESLL